jgi:hypothetical protein
MSAEQKKGIDWISEIPEILENTEQAMRMQEIVLEAKLTKEEKEEGLDKKLLKLHDRRVANISLSDSFRESVWTLIDRGVIEFDSDRNLIFNPRSE